MEKYFEMLNIIKAEKLDITKLYLLSCFNNYDKQQAIKQMEYCYDLWLDADIDIDLARLADIVDENWEKIESDEMTDEEIIEICVCF